MDACVTPEPATSPSFTAALRVWLRVGCLSFGGPAAQIALLHRAVVDERGWVGERRFLRALNFCMLLPGPEAQQLATYLGWLLHGVRGGLAAGLLFILPGAALMMALSIAYAVLVEAPPVAALFFGLKAAVLVLVVQAVARIARRALHGWPMWALAVGAFIALHVFDLPFPAVVLGAAAIGAAAARGGWQPDGGGHGGAGRGQAEGLIDRLLAADPDLPARRAAAARRAGLLALAAWLVPVAALAAWGGLFADIAVFFSKMAVVTFGGAYAVLAWVAQAAVEERGWLTAGQMLDGLGLAETTPGPLILVLQFVGFLAGAAAHGLAGGVAAALLTLWVTFAPSFVWIFLFAPLMERIAGQPILGAALAAVTAAVVGVVASLALWFGLRVLFREQVEVAVGSAAVELPVAASLDPAAAAIAALAALCLLRLGLGVPATLGVAMLAGLALRWAA